jgi:hypothetical protein
VPTWSYYSVYPDFAAPIFCRDGGCLDYILRSLVLAATIDLLKLGRVVQQQSSRGRHAAINPMRLGRVVDFKDDVLGGSRRVGHKSRRTNSDIWRKLPEGICWFACHLEPADVEKIYVYADRNWKNAFGTFNLSALSATKLVPDDEHHHKSRIERLMHTLSTGQKFRSLALVAFSGEGPFVMIDGNHRAAAMVRLGMLPGQSCYVGFHQKIGRDYSWFRNAICGYAASSDSGWSSPPLPLHTTKRKPHSADQGTAADQGSAGN